MNIEQAKEIVISAINTALEGKTEITEDMQLIGAIDRTRSRIWTVIWAQSAG